MADNVTANAGTGGATFASDDIAGIQYPRAKISWGVDGAAVDASATNPLPVVQTGTLNVGTVTAVTAISNALPAGTNNIGDVDVLSLPAGSIAATTAKTADLDSGAGTDTVEISGIAVAAAGGAIAITGDATNGLDVDVTRVSGTVTVDGSGVTQPVSAASLPLPSGASTAAKQPALGTAGTASADVITVQGIASMTALTVDGSAVTQPVSNAGLTELAAAINASSQVDINIAAQGLAALTVASHAVTNAGTFAVQAAQSGTWTVQPGNTANTTPWLVTQTPATSGGLTIFRSIDLDETEEEVKATAGQVYGMWVTNTATTTRWLKFYNATAANTTVGTTTPVITWGIPGNTSDDISALFAGEQGIAFSTAITVAATTGVADADTGAPAANDVIVNIFYK